MGKSKMPSQKLYDRSGAELEVNTNKPGSQTLVAMARASAGSYVQVWTDDDGAGNVDVRAQLFSDAGEKIGTEFIVNTSTTGVQTNAAIAQLAGGGFVVAWEDQDAGADGSESAIRFQRFDSNGAKVGQETVANAIGDFAQLQPAIAGLAGGGFVITWSDEAGAGQRNILWDISGRVFDAAGNPIGDQFTVNTITEQRQENSSVTALAGGGFAVVWQDGSPQGVLPSNSGRQDFGTDIAIQIFDPAGTKVGPQRVVDEMVPPIGFSQGVIGRVTATGPAATTLADGRLAVVWADLDGLVRTRILAADGTALTEVAVSGFANTNLLALPSIAALSDGGYGVSWTFEEQGPPDTSASGVHTAVYDAAGVLQGSEFVANATTAGAQGSSAILGLPEGGFTIAWQDGSPASVGVDIRAQHFAFDSGAISDMNFSAASISQTAPENIAVGRLSAEGALNAVFAYEILSDSTGGAFRVEGDRIVVADTRRLAATEGDSVALQLRVSDGHGNSWTENFTIPFFRPASGDLHVAEDQFLAVPANLQNSAQSPDLLTLAGGRVLLTYNDAITGPNALDVFGQLFEADGTPVAAPFVLNTAASNNQLEHDLAALPGGGFVATWTSAIGDGPTNTGVRGQIFDVNGTKVGIEFVVNTTTAGGQQQPSVTGLADGGFFVAFTTFNFSEPVAGARGDIRGQFFTSTGSKVGGELAINTTTTLQQSTPVAITLDSGKVLVAWSDASATGGDTSLIAIRATLLNADGTVAVPEFLVNTTTLLHQHVPNATALAGGGFVIVWRDTSENPVATTNQFQPADIRGQLYDADGQPVGTEFLINQDIYHAQAEPIVTANPNGGFTVAWSSSSQFEGDGSSTSLRARSFSADGSPAGNEFLVNQLGYGQQNIPAVTYSASGDLVFAWWDLGERSMDGNALRQISGRILIEVGEVANGDGGANVITGSVGDDVLDGGAGDDTIVGWAGNDVLRGGTGADALTGGTGTDAMTGGTGDDIYTVDAGDTVTELADEGTDEVRTALAVYTLGGDVENLTGIGDSGQTLTGNGLGNVLRGGAGSDAYAGLDGDDIYYVGAGDSVTEAAGAGDDKVITALGSKADFTQLYVLPENVERLTGVATGDQGVRGNALNNVIAMGFGSDLVVLDDGGSDRVDAGEGHDFIYFGAAFDAGDEVNGGAGTDTVGLLGNYTITLGATFQGVERLALYTGTPGTGGTAFNYTVTITDAVVAAGAELFVTAASLAANEVLIFDGSAETNGRFNVMGGAGADTIAGGVKNDFLFGGAGADTIFGLAGNDTLRGGLGADTIRGGFGRDFFRYETTGESNAAAFDTIGDFKLGGEADRIDLSAIDANSTTVANDAFTFIGTNTAFTGQAGQLRVVQTGGNWFVEGDVDGNGAADLVIRIGNGGSLTFLASDFVL
jgi:Ca2+-binding RTX toxin-like protein